MTNVNNISGINVGLNTNLPQNNSSPDVKEDAVKESAQAAQPEANYIDAEDVMSAMASQAALNKSTVGGAKTYDLGRYVTPEQAQRIAGFITSFEDIVAKNLESVTNELGTGVSENVRMNIALAEADKMAG